MYRPFTSETRSLPFLLFSSRNIILSVLKEVVMNNLIIYARNGNEWKSWLPRKIRVYRGIKETERDRERERNITS